MFKKIEINFFLIFQKKNLTPMQKESDFWKHVLEEQSKNGGYSKILNTNAFHRSEISNPPQLLSSSKKTWLIAIIIIFVIAIIIGVLLYFAFTKWLKHSPPKLKIKIIDKDSNFSSFHFYNGDELEITYIKDDENEEYNEIIWNLYYYDKDNKQQSIDLGKNINPLTYTIPYDILSNKCYVEAIIDGKKKYQSQIFFISAYWRQTKGIGYLPQQTILLKHDIKNIEYEMDFQYDSNESSFRSSQKDNYIVLFLPADENGLSFANMEENGAIVTDVEFNENDGTLFWKFNEIPKSGNYFIYIKEKNKHIYLPSRYPVIIQEVPTPIPIPTPTPAPTPEPTTTPTPTPTLTPIQTTTPTPIPIPTPPPIPNANGSIISIESAKDSSILKHAGIGDTINIVLTYGPNTMNTFDVKDISWSIDGGVNYIEISDFHKINQTIYQVVLTKEQWSENIIVKMTLTSSNSFAQPFTIYSNAFTVQPDLDWDYPRELGDTIHVYPEFAPQQTKTFITLNSTDNNLLQEIKQVQIGFVDTPWILDNSTIYIDPYWDYQNGKTISFYGTWENFNMTTADQTIEKYLMIEIHTIDGKIAKYFTSQKINIYSNRWIPSRPVPIA